MSYHRAIASVDAETKEWIDAKVSWILHQFGKERITNCKVVAADSDLLHGYDKEDHDAILELFRKVCILLDVDFHSIDFQLMNSALNPLGEGTLGLYQKQSDDRHTVTIDESLLSSPVALLSTLSHELCHVLLIGNHRITGEEDDQEPLTDLLSVFLGFGALAANSVLHEESWQEGHSGRWQIQRRGYLTMDIYGYALAIFAKLRNDPVDLWKPRLRLDVRSAFMQSIRFFETHGLPDFSSVIDTQARPRLQAEPSPQKQNLSASFGVDSMTRKSKSFRMMSISNTSPPIIYSPKKTNLPLHPKPMESAATAARKQRDSTQFPSARLVSTRFKRTKRKWNDIEPRKKIPAMLFGR